MVFALMFFGQKVVLMGMDYVDLGVIPVGFPGLNCHISLPYYKPEGVTQVPSRSFNALVIHKLLADDAQIFPQERYFASNDSAGRIYIDHTSSEAEYRTLELNWFWARYEFTRKIIQRGLFYASSVGGPSSPAKQYHIPYGSKKISMIYRIRFFIFSEDYKLLDTIESQEYGVTWELEWHLPPDSPDD
jgi:hypothetical protein